MSNAVVPTKLLKIVHEGGVCGCHSSGDSQSLVYQFIPYPIPATSSPKLAVSARTSSSVIPRLLRAGAGEGPSSA